MEYRPATEADLPGAFAAFHAAQRELHERRGAPWPPSAEYDPNARWSLCHRHLLQHDAPRVFVAVEEGRVAGYTGALA